MSLWITTRPIYAYAYELRWNYLGIPDQDLTTGDLDPHIEAWTEQINELLFAKCGRRMAWNDQREAEACFQQQTGWATRMATWIMAARVDHPELEKPTTLDDLPKKDADERYFSRFDQIAYMGYVPVEFDGSLKAQSLALPPGNTFRLGSSITLRKQVETLYHDVYGGTEKDLLAWNPPYDEHEVATFEYQALYHLQATLRGAIASIEHDAPCLLG